MAGNSIFVSGIDTDAGKSFCTAWWALQLRQQGLSVITMKFLQTGCVGVSEDIATHRRLMGCGFLPEDQDGTTCPVMFSFPASAQLAARLDGAEIDLGVFDRARAALEERYDVVLVEGAGGLMVPLSDDFFAIDYAASRNLPLALVTSSKLGSINHTVLSLEAVRRRGIALDAVLYNHHYDAVPEISEDSRAFVARYVRRHFPTTPVLDVPDMAIAES